MKLLTHIAFFLCSVFINKDFFSQRGKDGYKTVAGTEIVNEYSYLTASALTGATTISIQNSALNGNARFSGNLQPGDLLFIYNAMGAQINGSIDAGTPTAGLPVDDTWGNILDIRNVGQYEFKEVKNVLSGTQIELTCPLTFDHSIAANNEKVIVVRVPRYSDLNIPAGNTLTCEEWDGQTGGVLVVEVRGNTTIGGLIDVSEKGFRGGDLNINSPNYEWHYAGNTEAYGGEKGEGIAGFKTELNIYGGGFGKGAPANGGGGGNSHNGGGAGGANVSRPGVLWTGKGVPSLTDPTWTGAWNVEQAGLAGSRSSGGGRGGYCWSTSNGNALTQGPGDAIWGGHNRANSGGLGGRPLDYSTGRIFFGGGGGSGHQNNTEGGKGGKAAGIVFLYSYGTINGLGSIRANGEEGQGSDQLPAPFGGQANKDGSGGGGAGGTVIIKSVGAISALNIEANGGDGGNQVLRAGLFGGAIVEAQGPGGGGGGGYVGLSSPGATVSVLGGVNGTTNSPSHNEFPPNGATIGDSGYVEQIQANYDFYALDDTICGGSSVTINPLINGTLPTAGGQLEWYTSYNTAVSFHTGNSYTTPVLSTTTTYYLGGCDIPFRDSVTIVVSPQVIIDTNTMVLSHESCSGNDGSITGITASGGTGSLNYFWNNLPSSSLDTIGLTGGNFELIVNDSLGCADTVQNIVINGTFVPAFNATLMTLVEDTCSRSTGEINGLIVNGGSGNYQYYLNGLVVPGLDINGLIAGVHELVVEDNNSGCRDTINVTIPAILPPNVFLGNDTTLCVGTNLLLDATTPSATYSWQDASTIPTLNISVGGIYWVDVTVNGCTTRDSINVSYTAGIPVDLGNDTTLCENENLSLDATTPGATYTWQDASTNATFNVTTAGQYHVEVDQGGCIQRDTVNVTYQTIDISLGNDTSLCDNETLILDATTAGAIYAWQDASTNATFNVTTNGIYWVDVTIGTCTERDSIVIDYYLSPIINLGNDTALCAGETLPLDATSVGATYTWQDASTNSTYNVTSAGQYYVEADNFGCIGRDTINVTYQTIDFTLGNDTALCDNETLLLDATTVGATYTWQDASTNAMFNVLTNGVYWVDVTVGACTERDSIIVDYNLSPVINLGNDTILCEGETLLLDATSAGASYVWQDASTNATYNVTLAGQYHVEADNFGCIGRDTINISYQILNVDIGNDTLLCDNDVLNIDVTTPGGVYLWNDASTNPANNISSSGLYWVEVQVGACSDRDSINVLYSSSPIVDLGDDTLICDDAELYFDVTQLDAAYLWDNGITVPNRSINDVGKYFVRVTNSCGSTSDTINVNTRDCSCNIFVSNSFSPNNDGVNEVFNPIITCDFEQYEFRIFNKWGKLVFYTEDPTAFWNGSYNGIVHESAIYAWIMKYRIVDEVDIQTKTGHVSIIK